MLKVKNLEIAVAKKTPESPIIFAKIIESTIFRIEAIIGHIFASLKYPNDVLNIEGIIFIAFTKNDNDNAITTSYLSE